MRIKLFPISVLFLLSACSLSPGSYPFVEKYEIAAPLPEVVTAVKKLKSDYDEYRVPGKLPYRDGQSEPPADYWYYVYFYFENEHVILFGRLRDKTKVKTTFSLIGVIDEYSNEMEEFNNGLPEEKVKIYKSLFENRVLAKIYRYLG